MHGWWCGDDVVVGGYKSIYQGVHITFFKGHIFSNIVNIKMVENKTFCYISKNFKKNSNQFISAPRGPRSICVSYNGDPEDSRTGYLTPSFHEYWYAPGVDCTCMYRG